MEFGISLTSHRHSAMCRYSGMPDACLFPNELVGQTVYRLRLGRGQHLRFFYFPQTPRGVEEMIKEVLKQK